MTRTILFQIHWLLGITAGLVLAIMGVTGAVISFEDEIMTALSPGVVTLPVSDAPRLSPDALIARASAQRDGQKVASLTMEADALHAPSVTFEPKPGAKGRARGEQSYIDPHDGRLLGHARGEGFFRFVTGLHRWLALPGGGNGIGRQITGFSAIALLFFALSGLYLRWPRKPLDWRAWFVLDFRKTGRNLYRALHAVIGGWVLLFYLLSGLTGLWWSYDWYRQGVLYALTGETARAEREASPKPSKEPVPSRPLAPAWDGFLRASGGHYENVRIAIPKDKKPVSFRALRANARHDRMIDEYRISAATGAVVKADLYARRDWGKVITTSMFELHRGAFFGIVGRIALFLTSLTMPLFTITGFLLYFARRRKKGALRAVETTPVAAGDMTSVDVIIVHASQTGGAERLARLTGAGFGAVRILPIHELDAATLASARRALFIVSTYGEGEPPDMARRFARGMMASPAQASHLDYAMLALGDREYADFCAFGHQVDQWLHASGATRLFDMIEMDGEDADAQRQWQQQIIAVGARNDMPDWEPAAYGRWRIVERTHLNPGSQGGAAFHIALAPIGDTACAWQAGDIAEIAPRHDPATVSIWLAKAGLDDSMIDGRALSEWLADAILPDLPNSIVPDPQAIVRDRVVLPHREYSIASIPADGAVHLLIRQIRDEQGNLGLGSGWMTAIAPLGGDIAMRLRSNPNFQPPETRAPMILIGNGTGLAGLRAHLRHRAMAGSSANWLLLGERSAALDDFHGQELLDWQANGTLARLDRTWSRDSACGRYVQHAVEQAGDDMRRWVEDGAAIYVCGSIAGMAPAVDAALRAALGDECLEDLIEQGRYRRDIY